MIFIPFGWNGFFYKAVLFALPCFFGAIVAVITVVDHEATGFDLPAGLASITARVFVSREA
jgi:hypothetical protein